MLPNSTCLMTSTDPSHRAKCTYPVIIRVVIDDMRNQRCLRNRALKARLYRTLRRKWNSQKDRQVLTRWGYPQRGQDLVCPTQGSLMDDVSPGQSTQSPCTQQVLAERGVSLPKFRGSPNLSMVTSFKHPIYM